MALDPASDANSQSRISSSANPASVSKVIVPVSPRTTSPSATNSAGMRRTPSCRIAMIARSRSSWCTLVTLTRSKSAMPGTGRRRGPGAGVGPDWVVSTRPHYRPCGRSPARAGRTGGTHFLGLTLCMRTEVVST